ncbi:MAG: hypothetical protein AAGG59_05165, partial [Bacteroidota bacterium]
KKSTNPACHILFQKTCATDRMSSVLDSDKEVKNERKYKIKQSRWYLLFIHSSGELDGMC